MLGRSWAPPSSLEALKDADTTLPTCHMISELKENSVFKKSTLTRPPSRSGRLLWPRIITLAKLDETSRKSSDWMNLCSRTFLSKEALCLSKPIAWSTSRAGVPKRTVPIRQQTNFNQSFQLQVQQPRILWARHWRRSCVRPVGF